MGTVVRRAVGELVVGTGTLTGEEVVAVVGEAPAAGGFKVKTGVT